MRKIGIGAEDVKQAWAWVRKRALEDFWFFLTGLFYTPYYPEFMGIHPPIHQPLCDMLQRPEPRKKLVIMARSFRKTTLCSVAYPIWRALRNPNIRVALGGDTTENSIPRVRMIREQFEQNCWIRSLFGDLLPSDEGQWSSKALTLRRTMNYAQPTFEPIGIGTNVQGRKYDLIVPDDLVTAKKDQFTGTEAVPTREDIEKAIGWYRLAPFLLDNPSRGEFVFPLTRWGQRDLVDHFMTEMGWDGSGQGVMEFEDWLVCRVPVRSESGEPNFPEEFPDGVLRKAEAHAGRYIYASQYELMPIELSQLVFHPETIHEFGAEHICRACGLLHGEPALAGAEVTVSVDPAMGKEERDAETAIVTVLHGPEQRKYVLDSVSRHMPLDEILDTVFLTIQTLAPKVGRVRCVVETIQGQVWLIPLIEARQRQSGLWFQLDEFKPGANQRKAQRIQGLQPRFRQGVVFIRPGQAELRRQLQDMTYGRLPPKVDQLDALATAIYYEPFAATATVAPVPVDFARWLTDKVLDDMLSRRSGIKLPFDVQLAREN